MLAAIFYGVVLFYVGLVMDHSPRDGDHFGRRV